MSNPKVIIHLEGGLVQFVYSDTPVDVLIMDTDEDMESGEVTKYHDMMDQKGEAVFHYDNPSANPKEAKWVKKVMAEVDKAKGAQNNVA